MNLVQVENVSETPDMENSVGKDLEAERFVPNFEPIGLRSKSSQMENVSLSTGTENSVPDVENLGEDSEEDDLVTKKDPYDKRSSSSQCRDRQKISEAANNDRKAVLSTGAKMFSEEGNKAASTIVKRLNADPSLGEPWLKCLKKMDADLEKTRVTPIACLAYLLGILPCSRSPLDLYIFSFKNKWCCIYTPLQNVWSVSRRVTPMMMPCRCPSSSRLLKPFLDLIIFFNILS